MEKNKKNELLVKEIQDLQAQINSLQTVKKSKKRSQEVLHESMELYHTLVEISPEAIALLDLSGNIIMVNDQALELYGIHDIETLIGKSAFEVIVSKDRDRARANLEKTLNTPLRNIEYGVVRGDGKLISVEINSSIIRNKQGKPIAFMTVLRDVTERKQVEKALKESEEKYRILSEGSISGVYIIQDEEFCYVNPALSAMFGYETSEMIKNFSPALLTHPQDRSAVNKQMSKRIKGEVTKAHYTFRGIKKDGSTVYCESLGRLIKLKGKPAIIGTLIDITKRRKAEEELIYKNEFKNIITALSAKFINLNAATFDRGINDALRQLGGFASVDRSYIFLFSENNKKMNNIYEWCALGIEPQMFRLQNIPINKFSWIIKQIKSMDVVHVPSVANLPKQAQAEKQEWQAEAIQSLVNVPMVYQSRVIGFLGFDSVRQEKPWTEDLQTILRVVADMFANVIKRRQMDIDIKSLNKELLKMNMKLKQLALRDALTDLYNHRYFEEAIEAEFMRAKRHSLPLSVIMLDVDYFKSINDVYGHQFGDLVLKQFAEQLTQMVRKYDTVIRYGGEEFIIITPGAAKDIVLVLAHRLLEVIKLYNFGNKKHKVKLKISVAIACFPEDKIHKASDFIKVSEYILDKVKETGGDKVYSYQDVISRKATALVDLEEGTDVVALKDKLGKLTKRANQSLAEAIFAFAKTIEIKDHYTGEHVEKTVHYSTEIAKAKKLPKDEIERVRQASILHDLGKIGISEKILMKKTKLTPKEYEEIKKHPQIGADILRPLHFFQSIIPLLLHHHEHWNGRGYPYGLKGEEIPLGARIIALADTYEALTSNRRYRKARSKKVAMKTIKDVAGTQFDPELVDLFLQILEKE